MKFLKRVVATVGATPSVPGDLFGLPQVYLLAVCDAADSPAHPDDVLSSVVGIPCLSLLTDKVCIVTGAASGIGAGIARLFVEQGAQVFMLDRNSILNKEAAGALGPRATPLSCDVRNRGEIERGVAHVIDCCGRVDVLVNNAGIYPRQPFLTMTESQWDEIQDINLKSMFHTCQLVLPRMIAQGAGKIVNISSVTFHVGMANLTHYVASKGGVVGLTRSLAREVGPEGVCINCITPGAVIVEAEREIATPEQIQAIVDLQSMKRRIWPRDIARVCLFLASELSDAMTGQTLNVDGGWVMH